MAFPKTPVDRWLFDVGFRFNPFVCLDAGTDPHIGAYLIGHQAFAVLWGDWSAWASAPAGGGKTALRIQMTRSCWAGPDREHPFPIPYLPAMDAAGKLPCSLDEHLVGVLHAGALRLLLALVMKPHWWTDLDVSTRRLVRGFLDRDLAAPLEHYLAQLREATRLSEFINTFDPATFPMSEPDRARWLQVGDELERTVPAATSHDLIARLLDLVRLLRGPLRLSAVYLLVDGIDGFAETTADPSQAAEMIAPLLAMAETWAEHGLFQKNFLPNEVAAVWHRTDRKPRPPVHQTTLQWTPPLLAEVIRQRVYVATEGNFGSLDALCDPGLRDTEMQLVREITPLPREALALTDRLLWEHVHRSGASGRLTREDLAAARAWYAGWPTA